MRKVTQPFPLIQLLITVSLLSQLVAKAGPRAGERQFFLNGSLPSDQTSHQVPFRLFGNLVYVPVRINNSAPLWFILDSGADSFVIDERRVRALGLKLEGQSKAEGVGENTVKIAFVRNVSFSLGGIEFPHSTLVSYPFANLEHRVGHVIDGVLGTGIFKRFVVEINYSTRVVTFSDPQSYNYNGNGDSFPLTIGGGVPFIQAQIVLSGRDPIVGKFLVDTGGNTALGLNSPFVENHKLLASVPKTLPATDVGASGTASGRVGRIQALRIGDIVIEHPITGFSQSTKGALAATSNNGLIGGATLRRFKVIFDYSRKRMMLEPNEHFTEPFEFGMSGALLTAEGDDFRTLTVDQVVEDSPAASAGLLAGDVIDSIGGKPATEFDLDQISQMFKQDGLTYSLNIRRGERKLQVKFTLRRLFFMGTATGTQRTRVTGSSQNCRRRDSIPAIRNMCSSTTPCTPSAPCRGTTPTCS